MKPRHLVYMMFTIVLVAFTLADILSDIFLRKGAPVLNGASPRSWDYVATGLLFVWIWLSILTWHEGRRCKPARPVYK